jgi:hypothetical protein
MPCTHRSLDSARRLISSISLFSTATAALRSLMLVNACLDCGTSWKAADLYKLIKIIEMYTNNTVDLSKEKHRIYMDRFTNICCQRFYERIFF